MANERAPRAGEPSQRGAHWADDIAGRVVESGRPPVLSTGISPSGEIHIGNMREVVTADAVYRGLLARGIAVRFNYVCDNFDPLRRVYPFLDPATYAPLVGRPLSEIPAPAGDAPSYAEHFLRPFLAALAELRIDVEVERADRMYKSGRMTPYIVQALTARDQLAAILNKDAPDWSPFNPWCPDCRRIDQARVTGFSADDETVRYACACGSSGSVPMAGGGKLTWRVDWPARWMALGVTVEPFGKDHASRGGSYDTGVEIAREVFGGEPPFPIPYEWIRLRGKGDMASSKGNVLSISAMLEVVPPEVLRYLVIREKPQKTIPFDPGLPLLQLADEVDDTQAAGRDERAVELSQAAGFEPLGVPYKHLVVVAQAARFEVAKILEILERSGYRGVSRAAVETRLRYLRNWLERFAPEDLRFEVQSELPPEARALDPLQVRFLCRLAERLTDGMDGVAVHELIHELRQEFDDAGPGKLFQAIYLVLLGKPRGPRAGWFISLLGPSFVAARLAAAVEVLDGRGEKTGA